MPLLRPSLNIGSAFSSTMNECCRYVYLAALVDGEGSISTQFLGSRRRPTVAIYNTQVELLNKAKELFGGGCVTTMGRTPQKRQRYAFKTYRREDVLRCLNGILPYLIVKRRQAELALEYYRIDVIINPDLGGSRNHRNRNSDQEERLLNEIRSLNLRKGR